MAKSKYTHTDVLDAALDEIKTNATTLTACSTRPTTRTEAITTYMLASIAIDSSDFTGPATGDGGGNSRKVTIAAQNTVTITNSGTASYIAVCDGSRLLHVGSCTDLALVAAQTVNFPAWDIEFSEPTAQP
jgi:hypothetical protein